MPELPEVETTLRGLAVLMRGQKITAAETRRADLRWPLPKNMAAQLQGRKIQSLERRAKYMLIHLDRDLTWMVHLGMSGRMSVIDKTSYQNPGKHDHVLIRLQRGTHLSFHDPRRFGMMDLIETKQWRAHRLLRHLGFEPLSDEFTGAALYNKLKSKKQIAIKLAIMDQKLVVGVGNIYASESLFYAGIDPRRKAASLSPEECKKLAASIKKVLNKAIEAGGSSLRDYVQSDGTLGNFQEQFAVYGKAGQKCPKRGGKGQIIKLVQGGRATFYCPKCQK